MLTTDLRIIVEIIAVGGIADREAHGPDSTRFGSKAE
jgi:hypothetical protein